MLASPFIAAILTWTKAGGWKVLAAVSGALVALGILWGVVTGLASVKPLKAAVVAAQAETTFSNKLRLEDNKAVAYAAKAKEVIEVTERIGLAKTEEALTANPEWANEPIPADVLDSLRPEAG